jgi:mono/diheme cytochrome c family protein
MARILCWLALLLSLPAMGAPAGDPARGAYLARAGDCAACHTAGKQAPALAGGLRLNTPMGAIVSSNITPDPEFGIGRYSLQQFSDAMRRGIRADGSRLYPAMPYPSFARMSDTDIADLFSYLQTQVAPVHVRPPPTILPFPFNQRWGLAAWDALFVPSGPFVARADRSAQWNRGAYLVTTLGHCGACHTPRGLLYQEKAYDESGEQFLAGAELDHWYAPDLGANPVHGMGRRSAAELVSLLRTGHGGGATVFGPMVDVVRQSTSSMTEEDVTAIAVYLKTLPARGAKTVPAPAVVYAATRQELPGAAIYGGFCQRCHGANGEGDLPKRPALAGNPAVLAPNPASLLRIVFEGSASPSIVHGPMPERMPPFANKLSDGDIADVVSYIRRSWGNAAAPVDTRQAARLREKLNEQASLRRAQGRP